MRRAVEEVEQDVALRGQVQRRVAIRVQHVDGRAPAADQIADRRRVGRDHGPVHRCATAVIALVDQCGIGPKHGAERGRAAVQRRQPDRVHAVLLVVPGRRAVQHQQIRQLGVPVHRGVTKSGDADVVGRVDLDALAQQQPNRLGLARRDRKPKRSVALRRCCVAQMRQIPEASQVASECSSVDRVGVRRRVRRRTLERHPRQRRQQQEAAQARRDD